MLKHINFLRFFGLFSLVVLSGNVFAGPFPTREQLGMFVVSKTYVVMEQKEIGFDITLKQAMQNHWKLTDYDVIDQDQFRNLRLSPKNSFVVLTTNTYQNDTSNTGYLFLNLLLGDTSGNLDLMPEICQVPLRYEENYDDKYLFVLPYVVQFMQDHVKKLQSDYMLLSINKYTYYNRASKLIRQHNLIVYRGHLSPDMRAAEAFSKNYKAAHQMIEDYDVFESVADGLLSAGSKFAFLFVVMPPKDEDGGSDSFTPLTGRRFSMVFTEKGEMLFYDDSRITANSPRYADRNLIRKMR